MKKILLSATALSIALTASAFAADLPNRKAPVFVPPPPPATWTGCYVGLNVGGGFDAGSNFSGSQLAANLVEVPFDSGVTGWNNAGGNLSGFVGGGQVGCNYQFGASWLVGFETDIQGSTMSGGSNIATGVLPFVASDPGVVASFVNYHHSVDYFGTVRGRLGWLFTPTLLVYGTGGFAYGGVSHTVNKTDLLQSGDNGAIFGSTSSNSTLTGYTVGGGLEWMFAPGWSAKLEYLYTDLGTFSANHVGLGTSLADGDPYAFFGQHQFSTRFHTVRAGVNYHFNWGTPAPVLAKF